MSYYKNYEVLANEVKTQAKKENIINWDDLSWGKGVSFKNNNHIKDTTKWENIFNNYPKLLYIENASLMWANLCFIWRQ